MSGFRSTLRGWVSRQNEAIDVDPIEVSLSGLPARLSGYRIAVVADLHITRLAPYHAKILQAIGEARPECILIAGDVMDSKTELIDALTPFFVALSRMAPTVAVLGNNDCLRGRIYTLREMYRRSGVTLLENETRLLDARGIPLRVTGLLDPDATKKGIAPARDHIPQQAFVPLSQSLPPKPEKEGARLPSLLLIHQPQLVRHYAALHPSLTIAGHAHGGQFRLPRVGGLYAPGQGVFPQYTSGLYKLEGTQLVVSRGLGNHILPLRLNNPPHLPIVVLRAAE